MYDLPYFKEHDPEVVIAFMRHNPFAMLCGCSSDNKPVATQVPMLIEERDGQLFLVGHMQRKTDHQMAFANNPQALAIFTGAHAYVSASWYPNPQTASTWNYMSVHAHGALQFLGETQLLNILQRTTALFENNPASTALVEKMPQEYVHKLMKAIVAFEIKVDDIGNVFKLSQNRDKETYERITDELSAGDAGAKDVSAEMRSRASELFDKEK